MDARRIAAWAILATTLVALVAALVLGVIARRDGVDPSEPLWVIPLGLGALLTPAVVGAVLTVRRPENLVGWILALGAMSIALDALRSSYAELGALARPESLPGVGWAVLVGNVDWPLLFAWPVAVAFVFPDGRTLSRRWRRAAQLGIASFVVFMLAAALDPEPFAAPYAAVRSPLHGLATPAAGVVGFVAWLGILATLVLGAIAIRVRLRRAVGVMRLQMLWLAWAACLVPLSLVLSVGWYFLVDSDADIVLAVLLVMQAAIALSVGIAITRYRLYEIERIVSGTVVYATLTALLAGAYAAITLAAGVIPGFRSSWATALASLGVAAAVLPLRARIQTAVDRRFNKRRFAAMARIHAFEDDVRQGRRPAEDIEEVLAAALEDPELELYFWLPESGVFVDVRGRVVTPRSDEPGITEIRHDGSLVGLLRVDATHRDDRAGLPDVLEGARLSIELARLRAEVRLQLVEVEASRQRIVEAGYEERRRLERDLHDGAQQRLVSLGLHLRTLQLSLGKDGLVLQAALDAAVGQIGAAITDLRQISAGIRPARLDDGLASALHDLARTSPVPVAVDASVARLPVSVEAAAYYVACEGLTNAIKHATASNVVVRARVADGALCLSVTDDGCGGAVSTAGSGLAGLGDRVAALGGTLSVSSQPGDGTRVEAVLPCES